MVRNRQLQGTTHLKVVKAKWTSLWVTCCHEGWDETTCSRGFKMIWKNQGLQRENVQCKEVIHSWSQPQREPRQRLENGNRQVDAHGRDGVCTAPSLQWREQLKEPQSKVCFPTVQKNRVVFHIQWFRMETAARFSRVGSSSPWHKGSVSGESVWEHEPNICTSGPYRTTVQNQINFQFIFSNGSLDKFKKATPAITSHPLHTALSK